MSTSLAGKKSDDNAVTGIEDPILRLTKQVMKEYHFQTMRDNHDIYYYDGNRGIYVKGGEGKIEEFCQTNLETIRNHLVQEVIGQVSRRTRIDREEFDSDRDVIVVDNSLLNIHTREKVEFTKDHLSLIKLPMPYDKEAKCPNIEKFLGEVMDSKEDRPNWGSKHNYNSTITATTAPTNCS